MALLSIFRGTQAECSARPVSDGTLLFATDTKKIYLDKDSSRIEMSSVDDLGDYVTKEQLTTALNGKANTTHTHTQDQITGLKDALAGKASTSHSHSAASSSMSGFMSAADKQKLDGIAAGANKYTLPTASSSTLGGVKTGANITNNSGTISLTKANVTNALGYTPSTTDTNTWTAFKGASTSAAGTAGYVPAPTAGAANRYFRSDGTWTVPPDTNTNTTYSLSKSGSTITLKGSDGSTTSVTDADTNTTYPTFKGATTSAAGGTGLVPAPATGAANRYLRSDGTWQVPPDNNTNTTYSLSKNGSTITLTGSDGSETSVTDSNTTYSLSSFGVNASATELNYVKGVTNSIQTQLNSKAASNHTHSNYLTKTGTAAAATKLAKARSINIVGDSFGSASFDGTSNISIDALVLQHSTAAIPENADLNSYTHPGWYMCYVDDIVKTLSNRPSNNAFAMVVLSGGDITQIVFEYMTSGYKIYTRNKYTTTWGSWGRVYTTENKPTYSEIGAAAASHSHSNYLTTSGTAAAASKLATARTISLAGDVTGSANFDGSTNISITGNIAAGTVGANELLDGAVTNAKIAADSVSLAKLGSDVGTVAVQSSEPSDPNVKLWIQI